VISALFTYTDPFDGSAHVENDIELPAATFSRRAVWLNQFASWTPPGNGDERYVDLPFDAAEDFHVFEIDVYVHETVWRVDGRVVRREQNLAPPPPQNVRINAWFKAVWPGVYQEPVALSAKGRRFSVDWVQIDALDEERRP
jgi:beta-glucanase (GH16 family)